MHALLPRAANARVFVIIIVIRMITIYNLLAKLPGVARVDLWFDAPEVEHLQSPILTN